MSLDLSEHKTLKLFVSNCGKDRQIDKVGFSSAMSSLNAIVAKAVLKDIGRAPIDLVKKFCVALLILLFTFSFIFTVAFYFSRFYLDLFNTIIMSTFNLIRELPHSQLVALSVQ
jgi:hypothetical protein